MIELATFLVIKDNDRGAIPQEVSRTLEENGWRSLRKNVLYALPWDLTLQENGGEVQQLLEGVEEVRRALTRLHIRHRFKTLENALPEGWQQPPRS
jgi:hypothetical protein